MTRQYKTQIGLQGSVLGWHDPWHFELCETKMRTGEGKIFNSQDPPPSSDAFMKLLHSFGVDFYMHHAMADVKEINKFIESINKYDIRFMLGNEYGNINGPFEDGSNRFDIPKECVNKALETGKFMGLIYDEPEHLQLHPAIYLQYHSKGIERNQGRNQWAVVDGMGLQESEDAVCSAVEKCRNRYGDKVELYSEQVFPVMYHALARGGMNPCPKVLKEEFMSVQISTAMGAAKQYRRKMGICVDFWGQDVGEWFTRIWGFPGHSPPEYESALKLSYLMGPDFMFTENVDILARYQKDGFIKTEFGEILNEFIHKFIPENPRFYNHSMADPDIVMIRSDDTAWGTEEHPYGNNSLTFDYKSKTSFKVFNLLSRGRIPANGITFFLPQYTYHSALYQRTEENIKNLPLEKGVGKKESTSTHDLFYPMNNMLVLDERADSISIGNPKLIFLAGSRMTSNCLKAVEEKVRNGAVCIAMRWLMPKGYDLCQKDGEGKWIVVDDFECSIVKEEAEKFLGEKDCWMHRFGDYELRVYNDSGDGITLDCLVNKI